MINILRNLMKTAFPLKEDFIVVSSPEMLLTDFNDVHFLEDYFENHLVNEIRNSLGLKKISKSLEIKLLSEKEMI